MRSGVRALARIALTSLALAVVGLESHASAALRVCANSDNFPLSDKAGTGYENKLAELAAAKLGTTLVYTWWPARENFLDRTLKKGLCDAVMGVPSALDEVDTTRPYYRSGYVFVSRADAHLGLSSLRDARLKTLKVGVYLIGNEQTPPTLALTQQGISDNVKGFVTFYDRSAASSGLIGAVENRSIDVAAVWGPLVGWYARHAAVPLAVTPIRDTQGFAPLVFQYDIAIGVRHGDTALRARLDRFLAQNQGAIGRILTDYGVPLLPAGRQTAFQGD